MIKLQRCRLFDARIARGRHRGRKRRRARSSAVQCHRSRNTSRLRVAELIRPWRTEACVAELSVECWVIRGLPCPAGLKDGGESTLPGGHSGVLLRPAPGWFLRLCRLCMQPSRSCSSGRWRSWSGHLARLLEGRELSKGGPQRHGRSECVVCAPLGRQQLGQGGYHGPSWPTSPTSAPST
jgi:hypothetical protein